MLLLAVAISYCAALGMSRDQGLGLSYQLIYGSLLLVSLIARRRRHPRNRCTGRNPLIRPAAGVYA